MAYVPEDYYYTKDHEWAQVDENVVTVGVLGGQVQSKRPVVVRHRSPKHLSEPLACHG